MAFVVCVNEAQPLYSSVVVGITYTELGAIALLLFSPYNTLQTQTTLKSIYIFTTLGLLYPLFKETKCYISSIKYF